MKRFETLAATAMPYPQVNVDTDQIIPARFLQKMRDNDFGEFLFRDLRFRENGEERPEFPLNRAEYRQAQILVADQNFGCGSSREHAVWALHDYGFRAVIAPSFGDIFFNNSLKNGLLPIVLPAPDVAALLEALQARPGAKLAIALDRQQVEFPDGGMHHFDVDPFSKYCLLNGVDELEYTLSQADQISAYEKRADALP
jgi:3-isopropylmalate/(R)-2-methylmalate dehydratase small subunit